MVSRRFSVLCLLLVLLSISALQQGVLGARLLREISEDHAEKFQSWKQNSNITTGDEDSFATSKREVPSCPDPLHNRLCEKRQYLGFKPVGNQQKEESMQ